jgi:heavy metal sensor kinase
MRSIRLSLVVYFAALVTAALAAVSWFFYQTTARTLEERRESAQNLIRNECTVRSEELKTALDKQLVHRAHTLTGLARTVLVHYDWLYPIGAVGAANLPGSYLSVDLWLGQSMRRPREEVHISGADDLIPELETNQEFFQTYRWNGQPLQRSESLGTGWFTLDPSVLDTAELLQEKFDDVELAGKQLRRVTLLVNVSKQGFYWLPRRVPPRSTPGVAQLPPLRPFPTERATPKFFIQYAVDLATLEEQLAALRAARDQQLERVGREISEHLFDLRVRLFWIGAVTLTLLWIGGFVLTQVGLAPLARLAEAVSRVSAKDFRLGVTSKDLPRELQPIADRLAQTLHQLGQAFEREKQAAADISHELRTPLASLLTTVEVALRKGRTPHEYQEILEECRLSGRQMAHLVERLLALARLDAGAVPYRPCQVDVADLTAQCADLVRPLARAKGLALRVEAIAPLPLETDPDKVREVLTNLLHNAIEYNRAGGAIDVAVRRVNGHIELEVADTGIGIPPEAQPHIFERFYRADPSRHADTPHAGLGLAIVKSYIDLMSGRISVQSDTTGSKFRVELPCG